MNLYVFSTYLCMHSLILSTYDKGGNIQTLDYVRDHIVTTGYYLRFMSNAVRCLLHKENVFPEDFCLQMRQ